MSHVVVRSSQSRGRPSFWVSSSTEGAPARRCRLVHSYVPNGAHKAETARAIQAVASRKAFFEPAIAGQVIGFFPAPQGSGSPLSFTEVTQREKKVLDQITNGHNNQTTARKLFISPNPVRNHMSNILTLLHVADRAQTILRGRAAALGHSRPPWSGHR